MESLKKSIKKKKEKEDNRTKTNWINRRQTTPTVSIITLNVSGLNSPKLRKCQSGYFFFKM